MEEPCPPAIPRLEGEFGLHVRVLADTTGPAGLEVQWLTRGPGPGFLQLSSDGRVLHQQRTPGGYAHRATIDTTLPAGPLTLDYGSLADPADRHRTVVRPAPARDPTVVAGVDSLFVVGDVHGQFDRLVALLENAGLVDPGLRWTGGRSHLVLLGDLFDRGPDVTRTLWLLYRLEEEAEAAGGRVHVVLGNHEIMALSGDHRYVHPGEMLLSAYHGLPYHALFDPGGSVLGRWLAGKPALLKVDRVLLAHGGVSAAWLDHTVSSFDDSLAARFREGELEAPLFQGEESVLWHRGYVTGDTPGAELDRVLEHFDADLHVVANTPVETIREGYGGRLVAVDLVEPATEMLLLVREGEGYRRYRHRREGPPEPL